MRILIIALMRSGGYQLNDWLAKELGYEMIHEPIRTNQSIDGDNIVVKCLAGEIDIDSTKWDKIIGLTREDTMECAKSLMYAEQTKKWHIRYEMTNEWIENNKENIIKRESNIKNEINFIKELNGIKLQVTYERIYNTKEDIQRIKDYIGIKDTKYEYLLDNRNRLNRVLSSFI